jgi:hypothetical protein
VLHPMLGHVKVLICCCREGTDVPTLDLVCVCVSQAASFHYPMPCHGVHAVVSRVMVCMPWCPGSWCACRGVPGHGVAYLLACTEPLECGPGASATARRLHDAGRGACGQAVAGASSRVPLAVQPPHDCPACCSLFVRRGLWSGPPHHPVVRCSGTRASRGPGVLAQLFPRATRPCPRTSLCCVPECLLYRLPPVPLIPLHPLPLHPAVLCV